MGAGRTEGSGRTLTKGDTSLDPDGEKRALQCEDLGGSSPGQKAAGAKGLRQEGSLAGEKACAAGVLGAREE